MAVFKPSKQAKVECLYTHYQPDSLDEMVQCSSQVVELEYRTCYAVFEV